MDAGMQQVLGEVMVILIFLCLLLLWDGMQ